MEEILIKDLLTGHYAASLDADGQLTVVEIGTRHNLATGELEPCNTVVILPAQAVCGLRNLLNRNEARKRIGARQLHQ